MPDNPLTTVLAVLASISVVVGIALRVAALGLTFWLCARADESGAASGIAARAAATAAIDAALIQ